MYPTPMEQLAKFQHFQIQPGSPIDQLSNAFGAFTHSNFPAPGPSPISALTPSWELAQKVAQNAGLAFSDEAHIKVAIVAAALAIQEDREPTREDVLKAINLVLSRG